MMISLMQRALRTGFWNKLDVTKSIKAWTEINVGGSSGPLQVKVSAFFLFCYKSVPRKGEALTSYYSLMNHLKEIRKTRSRYFLQPQCGIALLIIYSAFLIFLATQNEKELARSLY